MPKWISHHTAATSATPDEMTYEPKLDGDGEPYVRVSFGEDGGFVCIPTQHVNDLIRGIRAAQDDADEMARLEHESRAQQQRLDAKAA